MMGVKVGIALSALNFAHGDVDLTTLHWNVHRPCGTDDSGCIAKAKQSVAAFAQQVGAQIVGTVELKNGCDALPGWSCSGAQCDNSAVMVAPGWSMSKTGGTCMNGDSAKGMAIARVTPPQPVQGCSDLCVVMGHVPHGSGSGTSGGSEISSVCGDIKGSCSIMMGDWNTDNVGSTWGALFGGSTTVVEPQEKTCCYKDPDFVYAFDHTATNIQGATTAGHTVFDPQLTSFSDDYDEHKAVSVKLRAPGGGSPGPSPPSPGPSPPSPSGGGGNCCWGGCNSDCHADAYCGASEGHCTGDCGGMWCPSSFTIAGIPHESQHETSPEVVV